MWTSRSLFAGSYPRPRGLFPGKINTFRGDGQPLPTSVVCACLERFPAARAGSTVAVRILLPIFVLLLIVLFFVGVFAPRRSRRLQGWIDSHMERGEEREDRSHGRL